MYFSSRLAFLLPLAALVTGQDTSLRTVRQAFQAANIPEDLSITFNPSVLLEVTFPEATGRAITLHAGVQLPRNATAGPPTFSVVGDAGNGPFVVAAVDPDAPTPQAPTSAQIRHFLGPNFFARNSDSTNAARPLVNATAAISPFLQPTPPAGSDAHRFQVRLGSADQFDSAHCQRHCKHILSFILKSVWPLNPEDLSTVTQKEIPLKVSERALA
ncbi:putative phosphatidylethanolamine-binding protein [Lyophyllum shimeji]|uniref:Phosphatidylethanolamine-binding protein n=1 Tax=Lyophyllum shimeji TaxID=47721 RepID=A0A9P3UJK7_LYOSH|nr:putative phosphatidylethanolamine-binding protein [Lyophyllum shimeji]